MTAPIVRLGIRVRAERAEEALGALWPVLGAGAEVVEAPGTVEYVVYGAELPPLETVRALAGDALVDVAVAPVPDGWQTRWHEFLRPVAVGPLVVRPPWLDGAAGDLVIDPGACFGAGGHPTTRLCLELLLASPPGGALCDWGAGSGVLAIAAARLGWGPVTAVEVDPGALSVIRANASANGVQVGERRLDLRAAPAPWAPTVVANLSRELLVAAARVVERPPRRLLASGMLRDEADAVVAAYERLGLREAGRREEGEWASVELSTVTVHNSTLAS